jgi:hypothetical protein|tara:strand:- start:60 stop:470 length:411 start_codon:yes stop_codon:yes gene_type:complete
MGTAMERYLYFRTVADEDNDDAAADTLALPARRIVAMAPSADTTITVWFESVNNMQTDGANELVLKDSAVITVTAHRHKKVLQSIVRSINGGPHSDGFITVADDTTTDFDGTTRAAVYIDSDISAMAAITIAVANS